MDDAPQKWIFTVPDEEATYAIYVYAGTKDNTNGTGVKLTNVQLYSGIVE